MIVGYGVGLFASSNIVLPLLWSWPKATRLYREGRLRKPIPIVGFLIAPAVWTLLVLGSWWVVASMFPPYSISYPIGVLAGAVQTGRLLFKPNKDMEEDFAAAYAADLK
jgi:hypothetical protein